MNRPVLVDEGLPDALGDAQRRPAASRVARPARVLHLMQCMYLGGTEQTAYALMRGLHGPDYRFEIVSMHPPGEGAEFMTRLGIPVRGQEYRGRFGWRSHGELRRTIGCLPCDLVLVTGPTLSGAMAVRHALSRRRVLSVHYHHGADRISRLKWRAFYGTFGRDYARIIFPTDFIRREAESIAPELAARFRTIRNSITAVPRRSPGERERLRRAWGLPSGVPVVTNAGQLIRRKRWDVFLNVAARVAGRNPDAHFLIAGDGPERSSLEDLARTLRIGQRVRFIGWQRDVNPVFKAADLLLFNSDADAFGRTPLEAMAAGLPVVASVKYGGTAELIRHGENGILLNDHDEDALADYVNQILTEPSLRDAMVRRALDTVHREYGYAAFLDAYDRLLQEVLASGDVP